MASMTNSKRALPVAKKLIDNRTELYPPLDFSFHNAQKIEDVLVLEPRPALGSPEPVKESERYHSFGINLNHNMLSGPLTNLPELLQGILFQPEALSTLDLSFNMFTEIPSAVTHFPSLKYFYFHKNLLANINEIQKLISLQNLKYLTLHGNPIEVQTPYLRCYILCLFPGLRSFNCTAASKGDFATSQNWGKMNKNLLPKYFNKLTKN